MQRTINPKANKIEFIGVRPSGTPANLSLQVRKGVLPSASERSEQYFPLADKLAEILKKKSGFRNREKTVINWCNEIRRLVEEHEIAPERISAVLDWYAIHIGEDYVPVVESGWSLREKFIRLEVSMKKDTTNKNEPTKPVKGFFSIPEDISEWRKLSKGWLNKYERLSESVPMFDEPNENTLVAMKLLLQAEVLIFKFPFRKHTYRIEDDCLAIRKAQKYFGHTLKQPISLENMEDFSIYFRKLWNHVSFVWMEGYIEYLNSEEHKKTHQR